MGARSQPLTIRPVIHAVLAMMLAILGQYRLQAGFGYEALFLYAVAIVLFVYTFRTPPADQGAAAFGGTPASSSDSRLFWTGMGLLCVGLALCAFAVHRFYVAEPRTTNAWFLYLGAVAIYLTATYLFDGPDSVVLRVGRRLTGKTFLWLLVVVLIAAVLRLLRFDSLPFGTWYDEADHSLEALRILNASDWRPIFIDSGVQGAAHFLYLAVAAFKVFGVSTQAIRLVNVVFGLTTVVAGYMVGSQLFDRRTGLFYAALLAVSSWLITFNRFGLYSTSSTPLFALLTIGFLLRGLRYGRFQDYGWAGVSLGGGLCFYTSYRLFIPVIGIFLIHTIAYTWLTTRRAPPLRFWLSLLVMGLGALIVVSPVALFAYKHPDVYWGRVRETFIFADGATAERAKALWANIGKHVGMFQVEGDPNGRHNLPGRPMLDPITGALMVLGLALSLWRARYPRWLLLPVWLGFGLLPGILSLSFEAPQALRANGALPVAYLLAVVPLYEIGRVYLAGDGRWLPNAYPQAVAVLLLVIGAVNIKFYFVDQARYFASWNAYSTPETITAQVLNDLTPETDPYVISFYDRHPTVRFLAPEVANIQRLETTDTFPLPVSAERDLMVIMDQDRRNLFDDVRSIYPNALFDEIRPPFGGPTILFTAYVPRVELASIQGLEGAYFADPDWGGAPAFVQQDATLQFDWREQPPLDPPFSVEWTGVLRIDEYGPYQFQLDTPDYGDLYIGEEQIAAGDGENSARLVLAEGNHAIRVRTRVEDDDGSGLVTFTWRPPYGDPEVVPATALYVAPVASQGLLGRYFPNDSWEGPEAFAQIDPLLGIYFHVIPLPRPYTVEWTGKIAVPETGQYGFGIESIDESTLYIDGEEIVASPLPNEYAESSIALEAGLHDIRVLFADRTDHTHINLYWIPPWGERELIPSRVLFPPQSNYEGIVLPDVGQLVDAEDDGPTPELVRSVGVVEAEIVRAGLDKPRGIAVGADSFIFVALPEEKRVLMMTTGGDILRELKPGDESTNDNWEEPFDIAVDDEGRIYVLDAGAGAIALFEGNGKFVTRLPVDPTYLGRSRGIFVDSQGLIWIANTSGARIVAVDLDGTLQREVAVAPGQDAQPVDVAVGRNGDIYVVDSNLSRLTRFDMTGRPLAFWDITPTNSLDAPHLAVDEDGHIYMSEPETGAVTRLSAGGSPEDSWQLIHDGAEKMKPVGIAADPVFSDAVWVVDSSGGNVVLLYLDPP